MTLYKLVKTSGNKKLGASVYKTYTTRDSCPETCAFLNSGCFGENFHQKFAWDKMHKTGHDFSQLMDEVGALPTRSKLRINVVGDYKDPIKEIPAFSQAVKRKQLDVLNFTHHYPTSDLIEAVKAASYTVNFSTESYAAALMCLDKGVNAVIALPSSTQGKSFKLDDATVVICPAQYRDVTCENCMLCSQNRVERRIVVGFIAHGLKKKLIDEAIKCVN